MKQLLVLGMLLIFAFASTVSAQGDPPWPPDPNDIFAEGIEIVDIQITEPQTPRRMRVTDDEARIVRVYDEETATWQEYAYPDEVERFRGRIEPYTDHVLVLSTVFGDDPHGVQPDPEGQWLLDLNTGQFSRPELMCGALRAFPGEGAWIVHYDGDWQTALPYLCHTETGQRIELPLDEPRWPFTAETTASPDGEWIILFDGEHPVNVYAYHFASGEIQQLGEVGARDFNFVTWLDDTQVMIYSTNMPDMSFPWRYYYLADVTQPNSLERIATVIKPGRLPRFADPQRYEWVNAGNESCTLEMLYLEPLQRESYDLGTLCEEGREIPDGSGDRLYHNIIWTGDNPPNWDYMVRYFWRPDSDDWPISAELVRLNPFTGVRTTLLNGEIESVESISPDGRYATILLDNSGILETLAGRPEYIENAPTFIGEGHLRLAILDLQTGEILHEVPTQWSDTAMYHFYRPQTGRISSANLSVTEQDSTMRASPWDNLLAVGNDLFLHTAGYFYSGIAYTIVDLNGPILTETTLTNAHIGLVLPEQQQVLYWSGYESGMMTANVYDLTTGTITPMTRELETTRYNDYSQSVITESYAVELQSVVGEHDISVVVYPFIEGSFSSQNYVAYTIRLPQPGN